VSNHLRQDINNANQKAKGATGGPVLYPIHELPTKAEDLIRNFKYDSANLCQRKSATRPGEQPLTQTLF